MNKTENDNRVGSTDLLGHRGKRAAAFEKWRATMQDGPRPTPRDNLIGLAVMYREHRELAKEARSRGDEKEASREMQYASEIEQQLVDSTHRVWLEEVS